MNDIIKYLCTPYWKMRYRKNLHRYKCCEIVCEIPEPIVPINTEPPVITSEAYVGDEVTHTPGVWENCDEVITTYEISVDGEVWTPYTDLIIAEGDVGSYIRVVETCGEVVVYSDPIGPVSAV